MKSLSSEVIFWLVVFILEGVLIICLSTLGFVIFTKKARRTRPCLLLANQCLADCLVGITALYYSGVFYATQQGILRYHKFDNMIQEQCLQLVYIINLFLWTFSLEVSFCSLALIALERVYAVFRPFQHRVLRKKAYLWAVIIVWTVAFSQSSLSIFHNCYNNKVRDFFFVFPIITFLSALLVIAFSYPAIHIKMKYFPTFQNDSHNQKEVKLCRTVFYATIASMVTCLPFLIVKVHANMKCFFMKFQGCLPQNLISLSIFIFFANSLINFFIYAWRFQRFSENVKTLLFCKEKANNRVQNLSVPR